MSDARRKAELYLQHPDESPDIIGTPLYLICPPGRLSKTQAWLDFRDKTLLPLIACRPDDPNPPRFLAQTEKILAWRAGIGEADRFWRQ